MGVMREVIRLYRLIIEKFIYNLLLRERERERERD